MKKTTENRDKNGILAIQITNNNEMGVVFQPVNETVWMDRNGLCELFGCYLKDIDRCIGEVFEKNMLRIEQTCRYHIIAGGKHISYDITEVNLAVIIAMAFRLDTPQARTLRMWCVKQIAKEKSLDMLMPDAGQRFWWN